MKRMPFEHEYGDRFHHMSMMRTVELDEKEDYIRGTGPSARRFRVHKFLDAWFFYPIRDWMSEWVGKNRVYDTLRGCSASSGGSTADSPLEMWPSIRCGIYRDVRRTTHDAVEVSLWR